jgi:hypothetical protein
MLETIFPILILSFVTAYFFVPQQRADAAPQLLSKWLGKKSKAAVLLPDAGHNQAQPYAAVIDNAFLMQLQSEIEAELSPRPSDSVLRRHHDALIGYELQNRLAKMPV